MAGLQSFFDCNKPPERYRVGIYCTALAAHSEGSRQHARQVVREFLPCYVR
jgi:hypothetical protein